MSASPSKLPSGPNSVTPTGNSAATAPRKRPPVSIFNPKKKPVKKPVPTAQVTASTTQPTATTAHLLNGTSNQQRTQIPNGVAPAGPVKDVDYQEFSLYISKDLLLQGLHYHAMKLQTRPDKDGNQVEVNPYNQNHFTRPLHLHRRNARDKMEVAEMSDAAGGLDDKEREINNIRRAERIAEREANQALIAPSGGDQKKTRKKPQKKVEDVYYDENNPKQRQRAQLRYEEARPWHLGDFESKNEWVGSYEEPLSDTNVMLEISKEGFQMIPVEKWYRFTQTNRFKTMDSDEVEKHMAKKFKAPRWFLGTQEANDDARRQTAMQQRERQRAQMRRFDDDDDVGVKREDYQADVDDIDFDHNDEFQDDDEGFLLGELGDDDAKEIEKRIREEQRGANLAGTGVKDEDRDWDEEEQQEKRAEQDEKRRTKRIRKQLIRKERKDEYDSDSSHGEFSESSDTEDSEEERERLEEERKQEEAKKLNGEKTGASSRGTNTPTGRSEKRENPKTLGLSLKRPGSPDLSEMSGNESNRKKAKNLNGRAVSTSANGARSLSPDTAKRPSGYGSGSDTDTSRTGRPTIRLKKSPNGTPSAPGSRAQSPNRKPVVATTAATAPATTTFPSLDEIKAAIAPSGMGIADLVKMFKPRVLGRQPEFIALVKQAGKQDKVTKMIMPNMPLVGTGDGGGE